MRGEKKYVITESQLIDLLIADMEYVMNERDGIDNWREYRESYSEVVKEFYPGDPAEAEKMTMRKCAKARLEAGEFEEQVDMLELFGNFLVDSDLISDYESMN
jgi:hypothetical protein